MEDVLNLPPGWISIVQRPDIIALENELHRELCAGHTLYGVKLLAVARRHDRDDFLFAFEDGTRVAQVHLTWQKETNPHWPRFEIYETVYEWRDTVDERSE